MLTGARTRMVAALRDVWAELRGMAYFGLCDCERKRENFDAVIAYCQRALRYDPQNAFSHYVLGLSYARSAEKKQSVELYAAALNHFRRMLDFNPDINESAYAKKNVQAIEAALR